MPEPRRRPRALADHFLQNDGLYVHANPPRVLQINSAYIKQLIRSGDIDKLHHLVLEGQGKRLIGGYSADYKVRTFLKSVPSLMSKINLLHDAVNSGRLEELQSLLDEEVDRKKLVMAKDESGVGLLHKAVYYSLSDIAKWLAEEHPHTATMKDAEGRTPCHYTPVCKDPLDMQKILVSAGADMSALDNKQHSTRYYMDHASELELPSVHKAIASSRKTNSSKEGVVIKKSNIRIWIHQRDLGHLQQVVWEGHGSKLLVEHSNNPRVKKFLEAVPHIMGLIKDIHTDVLNDDLDSLKTHTSPPVPPTALSGKDGNGLTPLHKAAGLGRQEIAEYIVEQYPDSVFAVDAEGRTPLHFSTLAKDDGKMFDFLIGAGADESTLDNKNKTAAYYKTRTSEIDQKLLHVVPECPRTAKEGFGAAWDWSLLSSSPSTDVISKLVKKTIKDVTENNQAEPENEAAAEKKQPPEEPEAEEPVENGKEHSEPDNAVESVEEPSKEEETDVAHTNGNGTAEEEPNENEEKIENDIASTEKGEEPKEEEPSVAEAAPAEPPPETSPPEYSQPAEESPPEENHPAENHPEEGQPEEAQHEESQHEETPPEESLPEASPPEANLPEASSLEETHAAESQPEVEPEVEPETAHVEQEVEKEDDRITPPAPKPAHLDQHHKDEVNEIQHNGIDDEKEKGHLINSDEAEGVIEGIVNGENEIESVNEQGQGVDDQKDDPEILGLIEEGNMEQLAALVLNGDGERLIGYHSDNTELQAFLDNVATYMTKINRIHVAARDGSLRDLQAALDRRKFAIAKDHISPNGASPLHVATIFGNTSIVRYLAGRFPETVQAVDDNERTPLHYAAVLFDNGHYYNLLVHLGADPRAEDKLGNIPDYYRTNQNDFSHRLLLQEFGAEETADRILSDKVPDDTSTARKDLDDPDMISVLERCFTLLHGRRNSNAVSATSQTTIMSDMSTSSVSSKHMKRYVFDAVKLRLTCLDHNFYDVIWPSVKKLPQERTFRVALERDFSLGVVAPDFYAYKVFKEYLDPVIKEANSIDFHAELRDQPPMKFFEQDEDGGSKYDTAEFDFDLDPYAKWIITATLECTRNLAEFELPKSLNVNELEDVERILTSALLSHEMAKVLYPNASEEDISERGSGNYYTMNEVLEDPSEVRVVLAANGLLIPLWNIPDSDRLHGKHWPYGRGVFVSSSGNMAAWINVLDHLRIVTCTSAQKPGNVGQIYSRVYRIVNALEENMSFRKDEKLGYLSARPTALGNTLHFNLTLRFPYLIKEPDNLRHLCTTRSLTFNKCDNSTDAVRISNQQSLGLTELQTFEDFSTAVTNILQLEKDLAMSNSMHIAALFVNIFRRKRAGLVDSN